MPCRTVLFVSGLCMPVIYYQGSHVLRLSVVFRGVLPAVSGQFVSHGLRTFAFEGSLTGLKAISGGAAELQVTACVGPAPCSLRLPFTVGQAGRCHALVT